jgi:hypothetical protein
MSVHGDQIGHGLDNQFTRVTAEFLYTDNEPLAQSSGGDIGGLGSLGGMASGLVDKAKGFF